MANTSTTVGSRLQAAIGASGSTRTGGAAERNSAGLVVFGAAPHGGTSVLLQNASCTAHAGDGTASVGSGRPTKRTSTRCGPGLTATRFARGCTRTVGSPIWVGGVLQASGVADDDDAA